MIAPEILTRVEQQHLPFSFGISGGGFISFSTIAVEAGECQIIKRICTTVSDRKNMVKRELDLLPLL